MMTKDEISAVLTDPKNVGIRVSVFKMLNAVGVDTKGAMASLDVLANLTAVNCHSLSDEKLRTAKDSLGTHWDVLEKAFDGPTAKSTAKTTTAKTTTKAVVKAAEPTEGEVKVVTPTAAPSVKASQKTSSPEGSDVRIDQLEKTVHALTVRLDQALSNQADMWELQVRMAEGIKTVGLAVTDILKSSMVSAHFLGGGLNAEEILEYEVPGLELPDFDAILPGADEDEGQAGN